jgi:ABC-type antimicrobial peptide transport system, permease component
MVKKRKVLGRKLFRDMWHGRMQFVAMVLLCALGVWCFVGLDAAWRMFDATAAKYFTEQKLADAWVFMNPVDNQALSKLARIDGVETVQARTLITVDVDLPHEPEAVVLLYDGEPTINLPLLREGALMAKGDSRGCLIEEQYAHANNIKVGDRLVLKLNESRISLTVRGIVLSPEYVITANDVRPDPKNFGFILASHDAFPTLPYTQMTVAFVPGANPEPEIRKNFPEALIINHKTHSSTSSTQMNIDMFKGLSYLFPLLAYGVAALIVLTTLTRMIENQRIQMGTLKALGYHDGAITRHYLCYALYPSLIGALTGLFTGRATLPYILFSMESESHIMPYCIQAPISSLQILACVLMVALSLLICLYAYRKSAKEVTAALLRPKPPKAGKKLFLERFPRLWRSFSFNWKMVVRNLFRNKLRTLMSLVGLFCCTMLIITSLGLQDSVRFFVGNYYSGTLAYTVRADLDADAGTGQSYINRVDAEKVEPIMEKNVSLRIGSFARSTSLTIAPDDMALLHLGKNQSHVEMPQDGIGITKKLAESLGIRLYDTVTITFAGDDEALSLPVNAICEVNIGQGVYMRQSAYLALRKGSFTPTALLILNPTEAAIDDLNNMDTVTDLRYPAIQLTQMLTILQSMMGVFALLSGAALGLAFIVLYNMGILNFMERSREYATLKVLGYHQREIRRLIVNENMLTAFIGIALGVVPGRLLTAAVLKTAEGDQMAFASTVEWPSYLIACAVTAVFAYMITRLLTKKVKNIDMVEALKSVE